MVRKNFGDHTYSCLMSKTVHPRFEVAGIYQIKQISTGRRYIGSSANLRGRQQDHRHRLNSNDPKRHHNEHLQKAWNESHIDDFEFKILMLCCEDGLKHYEQIHLNSIDTDFDFNVDHDVMMPGCTRKFSKTHCENISKAQKGVPKPSVIKEKLRSYKLGTKDSEEVKQNKSKALKKAWKEGRMRGNTGKKASRETKEKMSKAQKGKTVSEEAKRKSSNTQKGRIFSEETRRKMSESALRRHSRDTDKNTH